MNTIEYCLYETASGIGTPSITNNITGVDPVLYPLADNGGFTLTHNLHTNSPAINAGDNPLSLTYDQRGKNREKLVTDIGAVEWVPEGGFVTVVYYTLLIFGAFRKFIY